MRRRRNTKIIATLGPASSSRSRIAKLFEAGADVFRLNFSHGTQAHHKQRLEIIRKLETRYGRPIGIMLDLQGPKLRVGEFEGGRALLKAGESFRLDLSGEPGTDRRVPLPHPEIFAALKPKTDLLVDDGKIRLRVVRCGLDFAETKVITGGELSDHKGVNVPSAVLDLSALTAKDREDLRFGLDLGVDWIALSFVQKPEHVAEARKLIAGRAAVMVKLEKPAAIDHLDEIVTLADAVMVARGDLGVEVPPEDVPGLQKLIIRTCRHAGKPVVVATQMLDSMVHSPTPTRAEASDVATAVYDGADAVMLSAETAVGEYSTEAVAMMDRIIYRVERDPLYRKIMEAERHAPEATAADAITAAARQVAGTVAAAAVVTFTSTGSTTFRAARERPNVPILGLTPNPATARLLAMVWGVHPVLTRELHSFAEMVNDAIRVASEEGFASPGERLVITAGVPFGTPGATNILRIAWVE
ncbi:MAG: pyruvate kinase [Alphaproteobacteria bacterium]|nr:pyruvate kinase [Alphaproteobacteria bacterium]